MPTLNERRQEILSRPIHWTDRWGVVHAATGDYLTVTDFCLWTVCEAHDVPAGAGYYGGGPATCAACKEKLSK